MVATPASFFSSLWFTPVEFGIWICMLKQLVFVLISHLNVGFKIEVLTFRKKKKFWTFKFAIMIWIHVYISYNRKSCFVQTVHVSHESIVNTVTATL